MSLVLTEYVEVGAGKVIALVVLNRPKAKNALSKGLSNELAATLESLRHRQDVVVIILMGAGRCFCAGVDLKEPPFADPAMMTEEALHGPRNYLWVLARIKVPVIAAVEGPCITGGFEIVLNCDVIIAGRTALFRDTHSKYGIVPGGGMTQLLPRAVGLHAAKWASLTSAPMDADRAHALGLVSLIVPDGQDMKGAAVAVAKTIAQNDHRVTALIKEMQHTGMQYDVQSALDYELGIASKAYMAMANNAMTQASLSGKFATRSRL